MEGEQFHHNGKCISEHKYVTQKHILSMVLNLLSMDVYALYLISKMVIW